MDNKILGIDISKSMEPIVDLEVEDDVSYVKHSHNGKKPMEIGKSKEHTLDVSFEKSSLPSKSKDIQHREDFDIVTAHENRELGE